MRNFLDSIEWSMVGFFLLLILLAAAVCGIGLFARMVLLPAVGAFWAIMIAVPLAIIVLLVFLELILRY